MVATSLEQIVDAGWDLDPEPVMRPEPVEQAEPVLARGSAPAHEPTGGRSPERLEQIIREALRILDGEEPEQVALAGDGWSLVDPEPVGRIEAQPEQVPAPVEPAEADDEPDASSSGSLTAAIGEALDDATWDGWFIDDDEPVPTGDDE